MVNLTRRSALGLLGAAGSSGALVAIPALPALVAEPDAMLALCEARRRFQAAYAITDFDGRDEEAAWVRANNPDPKYTLGNNPPPITSDAGLRAAIDCVASDVDFVSPNHARILSRALEYLDGRRA